MDSAKAPLKLDFTNSDPYCSNPTSILFKFGDDLRQDVLTLQILNLFDKLWKQDNLDLILTTYQVIATDFESGLIEIVKNSTTEADVQKNAGGVTAAFSSTVIEKHLKNKNPTDEMFHSSLKNFVLSCAAYCVCTYVIGIGDRHNDNIMISDYGALFHIDFGHFLGNTKKFLGVNRERAPFVFTPSYANVIKIESEIETNEKQKNDFHMKKFVQICAMA
eukprot:TRINITY_DN14241_c0_g1_i1.p1 TRINITY_DN14241_c0_g1~~TRINITY_DN14241_c0_g1_i1.p1  ORF type:complete len:219 (-),score=51.81 TRINITY_DN14241_c0_g1_i1:222-878(-)